MPEPNTTEPESAPLKPLTDPVDLLQLLGRFLATLLLYTFVFVYLIRQDFVGCLAMCFLGLVMQFWTMHLWRRLRDQRIAAKRERDAKLGITSGNDQTQEAHL